MPWRMLLVGPLGAVGVLAQTTTVHLIGVALFSLAFVLGQVLASVSFDQFGWATAVKRPLNIVGVGAVLVALAGVFVASGKELEAIQGTTWLAFTLVFVAGICVSTQMSLNGTLTASVGRPEPVGLFTYFLGSLVLAAVVGISAVLGHGDRILDAVSNTRLWYVVAGIIGPIVVISGAYLVRRIGVLLFSLGIIVGQLLGSIMLDLYWPASTAQVSWATISGTALVLLGVILLQQWGHRPTRPTAGS